MGSSGDDKLMVIIIGILLGGFLGMLAVGIQAGITAIIVMFSFVILWYGIIGFYEKEIKHDRL
jgi:hypothetical protein